MPVYPWQARPSCITSLGFEAFACIGLYHPGLLQDDPTDASGSSGRKYADSIESLVRNNIQKTKIDMANEVIDAGRFNMATTQEERKETLEALLQVSSPLNELCPCQTVESLRRLTSKEKIHGGAIRILG